MSQASSNMQWMWNEFKGFKADFNNNGDQCLVTVTYYKQPEDSISCNTLCDKTIKAKLEAIHFLLNKFHEGKNFGPAITIRRIS